ncbi:hypothetical protein BGX38DRAFT_81291 [Terfezia claveryi]|nr:hypothetical protein BGX38DRAFT_697558 [Terfezia claveryi]KAF8456334.1 hypothetical protein BGX38DRAFT_81291 [Terfezia claveryi]
MQTLPTSQHNCNNDVPRCFVNIHCCKKKIWAYNVYVLSMQSAPSAHIGRTNSSLRGTVPTLHCTAHRLRLFLQLAIATSRTCVFMRTCTKIDHNQMILDTMPCGRQGAAISEVLCNGPVPGHPRYPLALQHWLGHIAIGNIIILGGALQVMQSS